MKERLFHQSNLTRRLHLLSVLCAMLLMPLGAWAQSITVAGVSPDADGNFTGLSGVTFNSTTNTLTLDNATINGQIFSTIADINVHLIGSSVITVDTETDAAYAFTYNGTTVETATLTFSVEAIGAALEIKASSTAHDASDSNTYTLQSSNGNWSTWYYSTGNYANQITFVHISKPYVWLASCGGIDDSNMVDVDGYYSYNSQTATLTITGLKGVNQEPYNANDDYWVKSNQQSLNVIIEGTNEAYLSNVGQNTAKLFRHSGATADNVLHVTVRQDAKVDAKWYKYGQADPINPDIANLIDGFSNHNLSTDLSTMTEDGPFAKVVTDYKMIELSYVTLYDLWVSGERVTSANMNAICENQGANSSISFDGEHTLTLNEVPDISFNGNYPFIQTSMDLTINLVGNSYFDCGPSFIARMEGDTDTHTVTFTTNATNPGMLTLTSGDQFVGFTKVFQNGLSWMPDGYYESDAPVAWVAVSSYDLSVAGVAVTSANFEDVLGDNKVSYDAENHILTLNNATIIPEGENFGITYIGKANLTISLKGTNNVIKGIGGCSAIIYNGDVNANLTFTKGDTEPCSLLLEAMGTETIGGFDNVINTGLFKMEETIPGDETTTYRTTIASTILGGGSGTVSDPFLIKTKEDLVSFAGYVNSGSITTEYVNLDNDINCSELTGFTPIGTSTHPFTGTFTNSENYTISNLNCTTAGADGYIGLFGQIGSNGAKPVAGSVSYLILENCSFSGGSVGGAIAGYLSNGTISHCLVTNSSVTTNIGLARTSAGIVGESYGTITNCTVSGSTITASTTTGSYSTTAGGIVGTNGGTISNCEVTGTTEHSTLIKSINDDDSSDPNRQAGGIVGDCIDDNSATITVSGNSVQGATTVDCEDSDGAAQAGAIIGRHYDNTITLTNNFYEYTVKTIIINGDDEDERTGYAQRGDGNFTGSDVYIYTDITENNGAVMYTKALTVVGAISECEVYEPLSNSQSGICALAPGQDVDISLYPADGMVISAASLVYTPTGGEEQTVALTNIADPGQYNYVFEMPDADATLTATTAQVYDLWIGDTQVTSTNADDVLGDQKVSFTVSGGQVAAPTYTLTLNGATITEPVKVGLANLTIDIQGTNSITTNTTCIQNTAATGVPSLTFKSTSDEVGSLTLTNNSDEYDDGVISSSFYSNNTSYYTISKELALIILRNGEYTFNTYYFTAGEVHNVQFVPSYGVQIGETQIYDDNAADVFGDGTVSFDKEKNILTLNGASLSGPLSTSLATLTVDLIGENTLRNYYDGHVIETPYGDDVTITFKSSADVKGMLTMTMYYSQDGNMASEHVAMEYTSPLSVISGSMTGNVGNDKSVVIGVNYGITINTDEASVVITNQNRKNVLNDGNKTVQFDGRNTLILNGANIAGIVIGTTNSLNATDGLTVYLKDENTITNGTYAIVNQNATAIPLTLSTSDVDQGKLIYKCTTCTLTVANSAFNGFTPIKYEDNLVASLDVEANPQVVTIVAVMEPFVTSSGETNTENGNGAGLGRDLEQVVQGLPAAAATTLLGDGVIVNKILYTLPGDGDGYIPNYVTDNGSKVVALNSTMTDEEVEDILEDIIAGNIQPGTKLGDPETFAKRFHGMSFLLPAGYGEISLDVNTNETGILHVKVGGNAPVAITDTKDPNTGDIGFETIKIPYTLTEESYVFIYRYALSTPLSRGDDGHRAPGRKETATAEISGLSVNASAVDVTPEPPLSPKMLDKSLVVKTGKHVIVNDTDIEGIESDAFESLGDGITYIDLRQTAITGLYVDRKLDEDPFNKVSEKTFIYLPVGNTVAAGSKNVIVGSLCDDMQMDDAAPFEVAKDFVAMKAIQNRDYSTLLGQNCTIYLPFALDAATVASLGSFYELKAYDGTTVSMETVEETKANTPYLFKPAKETVSAEMVQVEKDVPAAPMAGTMKFVGTYDAVDIVSISDTQYYCFMADGVMAGKFVHVISSPVTINPFRAYMMVEGSAPSRDLQVSIDGVVTGIDNVKVGVKDGIYYDLQGRRVLYPKKGIYIVNGKKVVLK